MRPIGVVMAFCLSAYRLAQGVFVSGSGGSFSGNGVSSISGSGPIIAGGGPGLARGPVGVGNLQINLRVDPPSGLPPRGLTFNFRGRSSPGKSYFTRSVMDSLNHEYFGYEVLLVEQQSGTYLATFGKLPISSMEASATTAGSGLLEQWSIRAIALPEPRIVHEGDVIGIELMTDATTGDKLIEDVTIQPFSQRATIGSPIPLMGRPGPGQPGDRAVPTVEGTPRDFSAADAEMRLTLPRVSLNGTVQSTAGRAPSVTGNLVWFYIPGRGRYILSLVPRPELDFHKTGEVRGGRITLTLNGDAITLECFSEIVTGHAPYNLYVLRDSKWEPTAQAQKGQLAIGSVDAEELAMLKRP
jgi:hypothetical protein